MIIDTHAHLDFDDYAEDLPAVLERAKHAGVAAVITIGINLETSRNAIRIAGEHDNIFATVGIHPHEANIADNAAIEELEKLASDKKVVAIGECGLDYVKSRTSKSEQLAAFKKQMQLAEKLDLPVVIHSRESYEDVYAVLKEYSGRVRGIIHCMSGDASFRDRALDLEYYIAIGGPLTYKKNDALRDVMSGVPLDRLLLETDCPFLSPQSKRGRRNEPGYLVEVAALLAELHNIPVKELERATTENAIKIFNLPTGL